MTDLFSTKQTLHFRTIRNIFLSFGTILALLLVSSFPAQAQTEKDSVVVTLDKAIEIALSESPTMRIANRNVDIKKYYKKEQIVSLFPDASFSALYNRTIQKQKMVMDLMGQTMELEVGTYNNYNAGLGITLPVIMPTQWYNLKLSQLDIELALESARSSKIALISQIKQAYFGYLYAKEAYNVLMANYALVEMSNQLVVNQYKQGLASEFDKLRAEVQLKNQLPQITAARNAVQLSSMMIKVLIGVDINEPFIFGGSLSDYENEMVNRQNPQFDSLSLDNNSSLMQLDLSIKQLKSSRKMIIAASCPSLALSGNFQYSTMSDNFKFSEYNWFPYSYLAFSLKIPLVSWASTSFQLKQNRLTQDNLNDQRQLAYSNLQVSLNANINDLEKAIEDYQSNKETILQAEKAYDISKKQYEVGMATWLDLNSSELALTSARLSFNQSIYNYIVSYSKLEELLSVEK